MNTGVLLTLFDDPMNMGTKSFVVGGNIGESTIKNLLEGELGRAFTTEQWDELVTNFRERLTYLPSEIVLHNQPIEAAGRFPRETLQEFIGELNISVETPRQMGHMAMLLEANTMPVGPYQAPRGSPSPFRGTYRPHLPSGSKQVLDSNQSWEHWMDFITEGIDIDGSQEIQHIINGLEPDQHFLFTTPDGPQMAYDYPLWIQSEQFQKFTISAKQTAETQLKQLELWFQKQIGSFDITFPEMAEGAVTMVSCFESHFKYLFTFRGNFLGNRKNISNSPINVRVSIWQTLNIPHEM